MKNLLTVLVIVFITSCNVANSPLNKQIKSFNFVCSENQTEIVYGELVGSSYEDTLQYFNLNVIDNTPTFSEDDTVKIFIPSNIKIKPAFNTPFNYSLKCDNNKWFLN